FFFFSAKPHRLGASLTGVQSCPFLLSGAVWTHPARGREGAGARRYGSDPAPHSHPARETIVFRGIRMPRFVTVETRGAVALVRVDRPPANALDLELLAEGRDVVEELRASEPGAVVIVGRDGFFSAAGDLQAVPDADRAGTQ